MLTHRLRFRWMMTGTILFKKMLRVMGAAEMLIVALIQLIATAYFLWSIVAWIWAALTNG